MFAPESAGTAARHRPPKAVGECAGGCIGSAVRRGWANVGCIFEKKRKKDTWRRRSMRKLQRDTQTQGQAALLVALFAALLAALLLVRLELGLHLVLRPAAHVSGECKSQVLAKGSGGYISAQTSSSELDRRAKVGFARRKTRNETKVTNTLGAHDGAKRQPFWNFYLAFPPAARERPFSQRP